MKVKLRSNESWRKLFVMFQKLSLFWYIYIKNNILEFLAHERYLFWDKLKGLKVLKVLTSCETKIDWSVEDDHQQQTKCSCQSLRAHLGVQLFECTKNRFHVCTDRDFSVVSIYLFERKSILLWSISFLLIHLKNNLFIQCIKVLLILYNII